jgi:hypothetical protein
MKETDTGNQNASALQREKHQQAARVPKWRVWPTVAVILTLLAAAGGGIWTILWFSAAFTDTVVAVNFIVVNILSLFVLLAIIAQACIYLGQRGVMRKQWTAMLSGLERTDEMIEHMEGQLAAAEKQAVVMTAQTDFVAIQTQTMGQHTDLMIESVKDTRRMIEQNERAVKAAEKNAQIAEAAEAPYFGIIGIQLNNFSAGYYPTVSITYFNGGKTPAWLFYPTASFLVGDDPDTGQLYPLRLKTTGIEATFFSSTGSHNFEFEQTGPYLAYSDDFDTEHAPHLFLVTAIEYRGQGAPQKRNMRFRCIWHKGSFSNYDVA